jgi:hypothetical protein
MRNSVDVGLTDTLTVCPLAATEADTMMAANHRLLKVAFLAVLTMQGVYGQIDAREMWKSP